MTTDLARSVQCCIGLMYIFIYIIFGRISSPQMCSIHMKNISHWNPPATGFQCWRRFDTAGVGSKIAFCGPLLLKAMPTSSLRDFLRSHESWKLYQASKPNQVSNRHPSLPWGILPFRLYPSALPCFWSNSRKEARVVSTHLANSISYLINAHFITRLRMCTA
jgi:hypothetical protein